MAVRYTIGAEATRPWGTWHVIDTGPGFVVKRIEVKPGQRLSLQYHEHRTEIWTVVSGIGIAEVDAEQQRIESGDVVTIPAQARHRLQNAGHEPLVIIEVQQGSLLDEEDIIRLADDYRRA